MKTGAIILCVSFLAIVGVGTFFMGNMDGHESCLATAINGFSCPTESIFGEAAFHLNAAHALTAFLLIAPLLLLAFFVTQIKPQNARLWVKDSISIGDRISLATPQTSRLLRWRALHEESPAEI